MVKISRYHWKYPLSHERVYQKQLTAAVNKMHSVVLANMHTISGYVNQYRIDDELGDQLDTIIESMMQQYHLQVTEDFLRQKIEQMFDTISGFNSSEMASTLKSALNVDVYASDPNLNSMKELWSQENVKLIKSVESQYFERIANIMSNAVRNGTMTDDIADAITDQTGISERRAQLIARDQVGTLNGQLTKQRQTSIGINQYIWRTSEDKRVRPRHQARDGETFSWDNPPPDGHPGIPVSCRCVALPIIDTDNLNVMRIR